MYARQITSEQKYTLAEARKIIEREKEGKREIIIHNVKQKLLGLVAIGLSIASPLLLDSDATISLLMFPLGIYAIFTKENITN